jgi:hypothetical protein
VLHNPLYSVFRTELYESVFFGLHIEGRETRMRDDATITGLACWIRGSHNSDSEKHDLPGCIAV